MVLEFRSRRPSTPATLASESIELALLLLVEPAREKKYSADARRSFEKHAATCTSLDSHTLAFVSCIHLVVVFHHNCSVLLGWLSEVHDSRFRHGNPPLAQS